MQNLALAEVSVVYNDGFNAKLAGIVEVITTDATR